MGPGSIQDVQYNGNICVQRTVVGVQAPAEELTGSKKCNPPHSSRRYQPDLKKHRFGLSSLPIKNGKVTFRHAPRSVCFRELSARPG